MPKNYYQQAEDCIYCGKQLGIDSLDRGRKVCRYPNCSQRHFYFLSKLKRAKGSKVKLIKKFAVQYEKRLADPKDRITEKQVDVLLTKIMRSKMYPMITKVYPKLEEVCLVA